MKKRICKMTAMALSVAMFGSMATAAFAEESGSEVIVKPSEERIALDVVAFVSAAEEAGIRTDPVSVHISDTLNIDIYLTGVTESDYPTQLSAMMADNDLPDIFLLSDPTKQLPMLLESGSALDYSPYLEEYGQNTLNDPAGQLMIAGNSTDAWSPDGGTYLWGMCKGTWDDGTVPTCGHYIRWDLYAQAGYPTLENFDEDMLDVMEAMVALEPETADGQKTYGIAGWFGAGQSWGEWFFIYGMANQEGAYMQETSGNTLAISALDSTPINVNQLTDPNSYYWRAVQFMNKANQRGLLDPDSFTMTSDVYEANLKAGKYMFNYPGWMSSSANTEFNKTEGNTKMFISLPATGVDIEARFGNMYRGERQYVINANTEYPEACVALMDYLSTYEFSRIAWNGLEGTNWNMVDGVPVPTEDYLNATKNDEFCVATGANIWHHMMGYGNGTIDPATGVAVDLYQFSNEAYAKNSNATLDDFLAYYGQETQVDVYRAETETTTGMNFISFGEPEGDISSYVNELNAYRGKTVFSLIACETDEEFEAARDEMIAEMQNTYHVDEIFEYFYNEALEQADTVAELAALQSAVDNQ